MTHFIKLRLNAPDFFNGKSITIDGLNILFNHTYKGDLDEVLINAIHSFKTADFGHNNNFFFRVVSIEKMPDINNIPRVCSSDSDSKILFDLKELGFILVHKHLHPWSITNHLCQGWRYRMATENTMTIERAIIEA